jgi:membrane-bound lytic murein transglycosylase B
MLPLLVCVLLVGCAAWRPQSGDSPQAHGVRFNQFLVQLEAEAIARGLQAELIRQSYGAQTPAPLPELRKAEQNQAEFTDTLANYTSRAVSAARVARGRELMAEHAVTLAKLERHMGVPASLMVALWGLESDFGRNAGNLPLLPSLISMAYKSPRSAMFRNEVFAALQIPARTGQDVTRLTGSWAGATGQCQFMPSNVLKHARDGNADKRIDIWGTPADVFASTANFIRQLGYQPTQPWRWRTTEHLDLSGIEINIRGLSEPLTRAEWAKRGLQQGVKVPPTTKLRYYQPEGGDAIYMVGPNYEAVLSWNYSSYFATSVFMLADELAKKGN